MTQTLLDVPEIKTGDFSKSNPIVNSHNEWDPLEEVIVGTLRGAAIPDWDVAVQASMPEKYARFYQENAGKSFPLEQIEKAEEELEGFCEILKNQGIKVVRPDPNDHTRSFKTPDWSSSGGLYQAMPRDILLIIGNEIIESPMAWRSRYYEVNGFKALLKNYFHKGAKWTSAPKPELKDELYNTSYKETVAGPNKEYGINELEPTFDAADFSRCGKDIFAQRSNVTNQFGIEWLRRHLGDQYKVHVLDVTDSHPMHIDATFIPLKPGYVLVNRQRLPRLPDMFKDWTIIDAPEPKLSPDHCLYMSSNWLSVNIFMLDHTRVMVEEDETTLAETLSNNGFEPILCPFKNFNSFGGSFHCATADVRRAGSLQSYFED